MHISTSSEHVKITYLSQIIFLFHIRSPAAQAVPAAQALSPCEFIHGFCLQILDGL